MIIIVVVRAEVYKKGLSAVVFDRCGGKDSAIEAVCALGLHDTAGRTGLFVGVVGKSVDGILD